MRSESYTYRAVDSDGNDIQGRIVESNFSGTTRRSPDPQSLVEVSQVAAHAAELTGQTTRVLRDDDTEAATFRP